MTPRGYCFWAGSRALALGVMLTAVGLRADVAVVVPEGIASGQMVEFTLTGLPVVTNPFDPDQIAVDGVFVGPDGREVRMPAFWYQSYLRRMSGGTEVLDAFGSPGWRLRYLPRAPGEHRVSLEVRVGGQAFTNTGPQAFVVGNPSRLSLLPVVVGTNGTTLATADGAPLVLVGHCVCWHGARGTADYDTWLPAMQAVGENYTRLWMCPWAFGIENPGEPLTRYRLDRAWQLDAVLALAEQRGIRVMLCLDYHGMLESEPDYWGGNNYWPQNPYNVAVGGPSANQNGFFTNAVARAVYQKRLRYLVGRCAASPALLSWQLFNEIDNVYRYLVPADVAAWHATMGDWLKAHDPYAHLVTTSLGGGSDRSELWNLPQMDYAMFHSYNMADPAIGLPAQVASMRQRYGKPVLIGEYGVNWQRWDPAADDPQLRGFRQGIWAGLLSGSMGTSMPWYWSEIHAANLYWTWRNATNFLAETVLGQGMWSPLVMPVPPLPPATVGDAVSNAAPFAAQLVLNGQWGAMLRGTMALPHAAAVQESGGLLNSFVHGRGHPELRTPFRLSLWCGTNASLTLHLNSVSQGAVLYVTANGTPVLSKALANLDGTYQVNNEYNTNFTVALQPGLTSLVITNRGDDWYYLDWVAVTNALPAAYAGNWAPPPVVCGVRSAAESLLYVASPLLRYPTRTVAAALEPVVGASLALNNWPAGTFSARWFDPVAGTWLAQTRATSADGVLNLPLPEFMEDIAGVVRREPVLSATVDSAGVTVRIDADAPLIHGLESSEDLRTWGAEPGATNVAGAGAWRVPAGVGRTFYRAVARP